MLEIFIDVHNSWDDGMTESFEHGEPMERTARLDLIDWSIWFLDSDPMHLNHRKNIWG